MNAPAERLTLRPVAELSKMIAAGELSCLSLVEAFLERIERHGPKLHAFVTVYRDEARRAAAGADEAIQSGHRIGPYHGIPIAVKDIVDIEGRVTTGGSRMWESRISPVTATLVHHLVAAGMIILGKTQTVEFAMGSFGTNQQMGTPWNPWDPVNHRIPGGSSAGSGVSVAAGLAPWAIGTDTGGSVRLPASFCGLVGLKTTIGRVSCRGVLPLSSTLDTPGPMCRSVEDAAGLYNVLRGPRRRRTRDRDYSLGMQSGVTGLRLARMPDHERAASDSEVLAAYDRSIDVLSNLGATIVDITLPQSFDELGDLVGSIIGTEGYSFVGEYVDDESLPLDDDVRPRIQRGRDVLAVQYLADLRAQRAAQCEFERSMEGIDALLTPTTGTAAPRVETIDQSGTAAHYTRPVNLVEGCALSLPNGSTSDGLPTSLQIVCRGGEEQKALRIGWEFEQATEWHERHPAGW
jgi:aspartyl-tRNA(Asn)/glutamyl-tRNA(Gln) amidotransferase subunit A